MSDKPEKQPDIMNLIKAAPPGLIMQGTCELHKSSTGRLMVVTTIGGHTFRKILPPAAVKFLSGPMAKRLFGGDADGVD